MKTLTIIWLALATVSQAAVVVREVPEPNGFFVAPSGRIQTKPYDFNNDGNDDLIFTIGTSIFGFYITGPETTEVFGRRLNTADQDFNVGVVGENVELSESTVIGSESFQTIGETTGILTFGSDESSGGPWENQTGYIGFSFLSDAGRHYGWFYHEHIASVGGYFHRYAYETEPGVAITTPEPSASAFLMAASCLLCLFRRRR